MLPFLIPAALQTGLGIYQAIRGASQAKKFDKEARNALNGSPQYTESPYAAGMLADTQGRLNATSPAVAAAYRNINQQTANQIGNAQRNAASGGEAISAAASAQQQAYNALPNLAEAQQGFDTQNRNSYYGALDNMTNERDKVFNDQVRRNIDMRNYFLGRTGAANRNLQSGINSIASGLGGATSGLGGLFGKTTAPGSSGLDANGLASPDPNYGMQLPKVDPYGRYSYYGQ